jgi:DNA (cytosine-5)-methyltransferase 1
MKELSLFTGAGGGLLGTKLLGCEHIGYVEINEYCQQIIKQRIEDGILDRAPIFGDIRAFISEGYAESYKGMVDVITAGFPCQPFSVAGKQQGEDDPRNMWPETIDVIRAVRPRYAFLENVPGLLAHEYSKRIFGDLAESGFDVKWRVLSAAEVGAPHKRDRLWIVADSERQRGRAQQIGQQECGGSSQSRNDGQAELMANAGGEGLQRPTQRRVKGVHRSDESSQGSEFSGGTTEARRNWPTEPAVGRVAHGVANRVDRIKALGNGQVPAVVRAAWGILNEHT